MKIVLALFSIFTAPVICRFLVPPAGRCRDDIVPLPFEFEYLASLGSWNVLYGPDDGMFGQIVTEYKDLVRTPINVTEGIERFIFKDKSMAVYGYTYIYKDNIVHEKAKGQEKQVFRNYVLDFFPESKALYYYRCSDTGSLGVDTRFIDIPRENTLSQEARQQFLSKDASFNFTGVLREY